MSFKDIKGQDSAIRFLNGALENNRVSHAYIFLGPSGVGKKLTALNFAKALNCKSETRPCDNCISCKKINNLNHPDIFLLKQDEKSLSIKIDKVREMIWSIGLKPYEGKKKVYIIDGADFMTQESSNALLKTLEEPPSESVLILIAEDLGTLFRTIVSRSQIVRFFPLRTEAIEEILVKVYKIDSVKAHILSHLACGSLGNALEFKDEGLFDKRSALLAGLSNNTFFDSDFDGVSKDDLKLYLGLMLAWYRDILITKIGLGDSALINIDRIDAIVSQAKRLDYDHIDSAIREVISTTAFLDQNANAKLAMGALGMKIGEICTR
ncbi:MAG: DNA polymerase III subunit delta' [Candidatus Omnitrophica bacterium]|nr:DNA polymerase III subunit delta' [Candidatus Omnitrophota bacterium]